VKRGLICLSTSQMSSVAQLTLQFCRRARQAGYDLRPVTSLRGAQESNEFIEGATGAGFPPYVLREGFRWDPRMPRRFRALLAQVQPDLLETHGMKMTNLAWLSRRTLACPWVSYNHGWTTVSRLMHLYNWLDQWQQRFPDRVVVVCDAIRRILLQKRVADERIVTIYNAIDPIPEGFEPRPDELRAELDLRPDHRVILDLGRFSREKAVPNFLRAIDRLRRRIPEVIGLLVGEGPDRPAIEAEIAERGLESAVRVVGYRTDAIRFYAIADVLAIPSHSEGLPMVLLEAMRHEVPVVATRVGGVPEALTDGETGRLVPPADPEALAGALADVLEQPDKTRTFVANAHRLVQSDFSQERRGERILAMYEELLGRPSSLRPRGSEPRGTSRSNEGRAVT